MSQEWLLEELPPVTYKSEHPLRELFADAIDLLDEEDRLTIEAWAWEDIPLSEIAHRLGLNAKQSAHYRVNRALERLRAILEELGYDEQRIFKTIDTRGGSLLSEPDSENHAGG